MAQDLTPGERILAATKLRVPALLRLFERECVKEGERLHQRFPSQPATFHAGELLVEGIQALVTKRRMGGYINGNTGGGDCYEAALQTFGQAHRKLPIRLIHANIVTKSGGVASHAWLEIGPIVIDPSNHYDWPLIFHRDEYRAEMGASHIKEYTIAQAIALSEKHGTVGPWPDEEITT